MPPTNSDTAGGRYGRTQISEKEGADHQGAKAKIEDHRKKSILHSTFYVLTHGKGETPRTGTSIHSHGGKT